jgi:putative ABC transport system permease protein
MIGWGMPWLLNAARSLRRMPLLTGGAILTLAIGVGLNVAVFGLIDRALFAAPPHVVEPGRVFTLSFAPPGDDRPPTMRSTSYVVFNEIRDGARALSGAAAFQRTSPTLLLAGEQRKVNAMLVSGGYFPLLGARAFLGRGLDSADDLAGATPSVVLSHAFWRNHLQEDSAILGRRLVLDGIEYEVRGVMPEGFSGHSTSEVDVWIPFAVAMRETPGWDEEAFRNVTAVLIRLGPGENEAAAAAQAKSATGRRVSLNRIAGAEVAPMERTVSLWIGGVSILVLLAGLANCAILLMVRGARSRRLLAIRSALGASRNQLRSEALLESVLLAASAVVVSFALASGMNDALRRVLFPALLGSSASTPFALATALLSGVAALLVAGICNLSQIPRDSLPLYHRVEPSSASSRGRGVRWLLLAQTTLAVILLAGAGLFTASLHRLRAQDFGMVADGVVVADFEPTSANLEDQDALFTEALERVKAIPGVERATVIDSVPFVGFNVPPIAVPGHAEPPSVGGQLPFLTAATPEFTSILGLRIVEGRGLTRDDDRGAGVVVVNRTMASEVWPGERAVGKCIRIGFDPDFDPSTSAGPPVPSAAVPCREVVGVFADVRQRSVLPFDGEDHLMQYLVPFSQVPRPPFAANVTTIRGLLLKVNVAAPDPTLAIRKAVIAGSTRLPFLRVRPYTELFENQMRPWNMGVSLLTVFGALALGVAAVGIFAAFAHAMVERRREMAIRLAIGARPGEVLNMVVREAILVAGGGVLGGGVGAVILGRGLRSLLFATEPFDPLVFLASSLLMLVVAVLATLLPAREASRANPSLLLRAE